ncbi:hypothetical protein CMO89_02445 [Candidatus Woesearchaeota archaeon]|nr:hypothetical protein [Candidatus Woesearchaeota archaeon]|tara:strand:- start:3746 stop:4075 length:330 start_codon:yes stop_codon:yes gene_type:complete
MAKEPVTKNMTLGELVKKHPESAEIMFNYGLHCIGCHMAVTETIEQGAKAHGMSDEDVDRMVGEINETIDKPKEEKEPTKETEEEEEETEVLNKEKKKGFLNRVLSKLF